MASLKPRVDWVDYSKGVCMVLIVMMHSTLGVEEAMNGAVGFLHPVVEFAQPFRMPDFFLIAGLFLSRVIDRDWGHYADKKVVHYLYFYVLWLFISFAFKAPSMAGELGWSGVGELFLLSFVDPFGTLWFIYLLPVLFVVVKLTKQFRIPWQVVLVVGAALEILPIHTGWLVIDEFATRFVFFYIGYLFAPLVFRIAETAMRHVGPTILALLAWAVANWALVVSGIAPLPLVSLGWGLVGCMAVVAFGALMSLTRFGVPLRYLGENSIVVYLAFFIFMAGARTVLVSTGIITDVGMISLVVTAAGVIGPVLMFWAVRRTPLRFLFRRPAWVTFRRQPKQLAPAE